MPAPHNPFKHALGRGKLQLGCWLGMADPYIAEISAGSGFDWLLIDSEHAPNDLRSIVAQLQVIAVRQSHAVVRPPVGEAWIIKQLLDAGAQSLLIPMVESAAQVRALVDAVTYPPHGVRGVGSALARASDFAAITDYLTTAQQEICLLVQVENRKGLDALDEILAVDGIDGVFIGPSDLAADMGFIGQPGTAEVQAAVLDAITRIVASGKAAGILTLDPEMQAKCRDLGATFIATEIDITLFARNMRASAAKAHRLLPSQTATGTALTENASRYLQQLCKHWSHKAQSTFDETAGVIEFENGNAIALAATPGRLELTATVPARSDLGAWTDVIDRHLMQFAHRETLEISWSFT